MPPVPAVTANSTAPSFVNGARDGPHANCTCRFLKTIRRGAPGTTSSRRTHQTSSPDGSTSLNSSVFDGPAPRSVNEKA